VCTWTSMTEALRECPGVAVAAHLHSTQKSAASNSSNKKAAANNLRVGNNTADFW